MVPTVTAPSDEGSPLAPETWAVQFYYHPLSGQVHPHPGSDPSRTADLYTQFRQNVDQDKARPALHEAIARASSDARAVDCFLVCFGRIKEYDRPELDHPFGALIAQLAEGAEFAAVVHASFNLTAYLTKAPFGWQATSLPQPPPPPSLPEVPELSPGPIADAPDGEAYETFAADQRRVEDALRERPASTTKAEDGTIDTAIPPPVIPLPEEPPAPASQHLPPPLTSTPGALRDLLAIARDPALYLSQRLGELEANYEGNPSAITAETTAIREAITRLTHGDKKGESPLLSSSGDEDADTNWIGGAALAQLECLEQQLLEKQKPLILDVQNFLDRLAGASSFGTNQVNALVCVRVLGMTRNFGLRLLYNGEDVIINYLSNSQDGGVYRVQTATRVRGSRYKRPIFPKLQVLSHTHSAGTGSSEEEKKSDN